MSFKKHMEMLFSFSQDVTLWWLILKSLFRCKVTSSKRQSLRIWLCCDAILMNTVPGNVFGRWCFEMSELTLWIPAGHTGKKGGGHLEQKSSQIWYLGPHLGDQEEETSELKRYQTLLVKFVVTGFLLPTMSFFSTQQVGRSLHLNFLKFCWGFPRCPTGLRPTHCRGCGLDPQSELRFYMPGKQAKKNEQIKINLKALSLVHHPQQGWSSAPSSALQHSLWKHSHPGSVSTQYVSFWRCLI